MTYVAVWVPRSIAHYTEFKRELGDGPIVDPRIVVPCRVRNWIDDGDRFAGDTIRFTLELGARNLREVPPETDRFDGVNRDGGRDFRPPTETGDPFEIEGLPASGWDTENPIACRYTVIGTLIAEVPDDRDADDVLRIVESLYRHIARTEWTVLGEQLDLDDIPVGTAVVETDAYDRNAVFSQVCHDFLSQCIRKTRDFDPGTDESEISDLLQRVEQTEAGYAYAVEKWDLDDPELGQHIDYAKEIVGMLFKNIEITSEQHRQRQLTTIQVLAFLGTLLIIGIGLFRLAIRMNVLSL
ncbi:hypothetical protein [Halorhabdus amylolytica]|uniref:hypothetical protein n=1 Tax=Halorhabdus amylolytica TaxID=2559573 RepID=UPI0010AAC7D4|nr:hypothetical protein [Halorhabdus amylolytica]